MRKTCALLAVAGLALLVGCSGDDDAGGETTTTTAESTTTTTTVESTTTTTVTTTTADPADFTSAPGYRPNYDRLMDLRAAAVAAGLECENEYPPDLPMATIDCDFDTLLALYSSPDERASARAPLTGPVNPDMLYLDGGNWSVIAPADDVRLIAPSLGGTIKEYRGLPGV